MKIFQATNAWQGRKWRGAAGGQGGQLPTQFWADYYLPTQI